jgi:hypothetical protein
MYHVVVASGNNTNRRKPRSKMSPVAIWWGTKYNFDTKSFTMPMHPVSSLLPFFFHPAHYGINDRNDPSFSYDDDDYHHLWMAVVMGYRSIFRYGVLPGLEVDKMLLMLSRLPFAALVPLERAEVWQLHISSWAVDSHCPVPSGLLRANVQIEA